MRTRDAIMMSAVLGLSGCVATPSVQYSMVTKPEDMPKNAFDSYYLQSSQILIANDTPTPVSPAAAGTASAASIKITSVPAEYESFKMALSHNDAFWKSTSLNITKQANTDLVQEAGSSVTNNSIDIINEVGAFVKAVIPLVAAFDGDGTVDPSKLPIRIDIQDQIAKLGDNGDKRGGFGIHPVGVSGVLIVVGPVPPDAVAVSALKFPLASGRYLYAACRTADVHISVAKGAASPQNFEQQVKIADPNFIQQVGFPAKGKITAHSECGVSVATDATGDTTNALTIATAMATQAKAITDAAATAKAGGGN